MASSAFPQLNRVILSLVLGAALVFVTGCGDDSKSDDDTVDAVEDVMDVAEDVDVDDTSDTSDNGDTDGADDSDGADGDDVPDADTPDAVDMPDVPIDDRDGDLVPDGDDNCPDDQNSAQEDGDGDGFGDVCDSCPVIPEQSNNPAVCQPVAEEEPNNEFPFNASGGTAVPFAVSGTVGEYDEENDVADMDFFVFEAEAGQLLRIDVDVSDSDCFCAAEIGSVDLSDGYLRVLFTQNGTRDFREFFVPRTGTYYVAFYDLINEQPIPGNVGGPTYTYSASVYEVEPLVVDEGAFPVAYSGGNDRRVRFTRVASPSDQIVRAEAFSSPQADNAQHEPSLIFWDPADGTIVAETTSDDLQNTGRVSLLAPPAPSGEVWLIEDFLFTFIVNTVTVVAEVEPALGELEPNDAVDEASPLPLATAGRGTIAAPDTSTDTDYFTFAAPAGKRVAVQVTSDGEMQPNVELGIDEGFFRRYLGIEGSSLEYLTSEGRAYVVRVRDARNVVSGPDVGGSDFGYSVEVTISDPQPQALGGAPTTGNGVIDPPGSHVLYSVDVPALSGHELRLDTSNIPSPVMRVYDPTAGELIAETTDGFATLFLDAEGPVWVDIGDRNGNGGPAVTFSLDYAALPPTASLPLTDSGQIDEQNPVATWVVELEKGKVLDVDVSSSNGSFIPVLTITDIADNEELVDVFGVDGFGRLNPETRTVLLRLEHSGSVAGQQFPWTMDVQSLDPAVVMEAAGDNSTFAAAQSITTALLVRVTGQLDDGDDLDVYAVTLQPETDYRFYTTWADDRVSTWYTRLELFDGGEQELQESIFDGEAGFSHIDFTTPAGMPQTYYLRVEHWFGSTTDQYSLVIVED